MLRITYSETMTRLMDREFNAGWPSANCTLHMAWHFHTCRTDFGMYPHDETEGIIYSYLQEHLVYVPIPGKIPDPDRWISAQDQSH